MWRRRAFGAFGLFTAIVVAYIAGRLVVLMGLGYSSAGPLSAVAFFVAAVVIDRAGGSRPAGWR
jgi:hypothetical protein